MAHMDINSEAPVADHDQEMPLDAPTSQESEHVSLTLHESVQVQVELDVQENEPTSSPPEEADPPMFFVDTQGDSGLAFKGKKSTMSRPASPTPSDSSGELVFHGRGSAVVVQDDPPASTSKHPVASQDPLNALVRAVEAESTTSTLNWGKPKPMKEEPEFWRHGNGTISARGTDWPLDKPEPSPPPPHKAIKPASRKTKNARKKQNKLLRRELGSDDELMRDYIDNMDPEDREAFGFTTAADGDSTDDLFNKLLDQDGEDVRISIDTSSGSDSWHTDNGDDDEDDGEESDDLDDLDSSDLESELEYNEREQYEDEADLRQRQRDAMTDEEIARILAKQEEYGMGGDDLYLFDDSGLGVGDIPAARAGLGSISGTVKLGSLSRSKNGMRKSAKRGGRKSDHFPDASLMADVLEQDPYGGFDIMDHDRPSLRPKTKGRKSAGPLPEELGLSDDELIADLQSAWSNDRSKKAARKAERQELREMGLLGSGKKGNKKGNKFKPDLAIKYDEGISMSQIRIEFEDFLDIDEETTRAFPPMDKKDRKIMHEMASHFNLKSKSVGSGKNRAPVLIKTSRTVDFTEERFAKASRIVQRGFFRQPGAKGKTREFAADKMKKRGGGGAAGTLANGHIVGADAPEIGASNFGRKLMEKMGWQAGMSLGVEGSSGLLVPVQARIKSGKGGLG